MPSKCSDAPIGTITLTTQEPLSRTTLNLFRSIIENVPRSVHPTAVKCAPAGVRPKEGGDPTLSGGKGNKVLPDNWSLQTGALNWRVVVRICRLLSPILTPESEFRGRR